MSPLPYTVTARHDAERRQLVNIANDVTALHGLMAPVETPEAVYRALRDAHDALLRALRAHDAHHRPEVTP